MEERLDRIEGKIDRLEGKLDTALQHATEARTAVGWLKWVAGGAWAAIAVMFGTHR